MDDTVIRRRLRLKMEFMNDAEVDATPEPMPISQPILLPIPTPSARRRRSPSNRFISMLRSAVSPRRRMPCRSPAGSLKRDAADSRPTAGDPTLLPSSMPLTDRQGIAQMFGDDFAAAVVALPVGDWQGPVPSAFGLHLVRVTDRWPGRLPALAEIRPQVEREWTE